MSTRSTTRFVSRGNNEDVTLVNIYQQYDGYLSGVGREIAEYILSKKITNGYSSGMDLSNCANGFDCLAAQFIRDFKKGIGGLYITLPDDEQEYHYNLICEEEKVFESVDRNGTSADDCITIEVYNWGKLIFTGTASELLEKINKGSE